MAIQPPHQLVRQDRPDVVVAEACSECGLIYSPGGTAAQCCPPPACECGRADKKPGYTCCAECRRERESERLQKRFEAATKVKLSEYDGKMLCNPSGCGGSRGYGYVDVDDILPPDDEDHEEDKCGWKWACTSSPLGRIDARDLIQETLDSEEWFEEAVEQFDTDSLQELLDKWVAKHSEIVCYSSNDDVVVLLDQEEKPLRGNDRRNDTKIYHDKFIEDEVGGQFGKYIRSLRYPSGTEVHVFEEQDRRYVLFVSNCSLTDIQQKAIAGLSCIELPLLKGKLQHVRVVNDAGDIKTSGRP